MLTPEEIRDRFTYHAPSDAGKTRHHTLSAAFIDLADLIESTVPDGREKALAFTKLEEAKFHASSGVARNPETR